ncbi:MAG: hypothetical protein ACJ8AG_17515 [Ktedonobacteraceae bacterium]
MFTVWLLSMAVLLWMILRLISYSLQPSWGSVNSTPARVYTVVNNVKAYVFTEGLIRAQGSKIDAMRWEYVEAVWEKIVKHRYRGLIPIYTSYHYTCVEVMELSSSSGAL